jgi:hypothetical protein
MAVSRSACKQCRNKQDTLKHTRTTVFLWVISMDNLYGDTLSALKELQTQELSIIRISKPISTASLQDTAVRTSDVSQDESPTPTSLQDDLSHYKV